MVLIITIIIIKCKYSNNTLWQASDLPRLFLSARGGGVLCQLVPPPYMKKLSLEFEVLHISGDFLHIFFYEIVRELDFPPIK